MQTTNRFLDDLAKMANGAVSTLAGVKDEIDILVRQRIERLLADADMVPREEFEAVKEMAARARAGQEDLEARVAELEKALGRKPAQKAAQKPAQKAAQKAAKKAAKKPAKKPAKKAAKASPKKTRKPARKT